MALLAILTIYPFTTKYRIFIDIIIKLKGPTDRVTPVMGSRQLHELTVIGIVNVSERVEQISHESREKLVQFHVN